VLEVWAETSAPRREIELLLADAPQEAPQAARAATAQAIDDAEELVSGFSNAISHVLAWFVAQLDRTSRQAHPLQMMCHWCRAAAPCARMARNWNMTLRKNNAAQC
jgi:uncharacterized protein YggE